MLFSRVMAAAVAGVFGVKNLYPVGDRTAVTAAKAVTSFLKPPPEDELSTNFSFASVLRLKMVLPDRAGKRPEKTARTS